MSELTEMLKAAISELADQVPAVMVYGGATYIGVASATLNKREIEDAGVNLPWDTTITFDSSLFSTLPDLSTGTKEAVLDDGETYLIVSISALPDGGPVNFYLKRKV